MHVAMFLAAQIAAFTPEGLRDFDAWIDAFKHLIVNFTMAVAIVFFCWQYLRNKGK